MRGRGRAVVVGLAALAVAVGVASPARAVDGPAPGPAAATTGPPPDLILLPPAGTVALTFDDGPHPGITPDILDILDEHDAKATFFVVGERVEQYPALVADIVARGHSVQNHTYGHPDLTTLDDAAVVGQIAGTTIEMAAAGAPAPSCLRPPYGAFDERIRQLARATGGLELRTWHVDPEDWKLPGSSAIRDAVGEVQSGQIVLLHDGLDSSWQTVDALPGILEDLEARGLGTETICQRWAEWGFYDVRRAHPFHPEITWLADAGIANGYPDNTFRPGDPVSRQAMAAFLYRLRGVPPVPPDAPTFPDVPPTHRFVNAIRWLAAVGVATGDDAGTFRPTAPVSRQAMAAFLWRLAGSPAVPLAAAPFTDVGVDHRFAGPIAWMGATGIAEGMPDGSFRPTAPVSRQAMAAFLQRFDDVVSSP